MTTEEYNNAVQTLSNRIYRYVLKCLRNEEDARDIVQDSFMKLWQHKDDIAVAKAKSWLFTTAHNGLINFVKKKNRTTYMDEVESDGFAMDHERFELKEIVNKCLERLPYQQKSIIMLRDYEGYKYHEIAEILGLSESQVKVYLFRARQKIKNQLKDLTILSS